MTADHISREKTRPRVLIVDDSDVNRTLLERLFATEGYHTATAGNGQEALQSLQKTSFDLVMLDIMMPILDGLTVLDRIRKNPATATLPVILISAMSESDDIVRGLELGANDYLAKPIDMSIALARAKTQITLKRLLDERNRTIHQLRQSQEMRERFFQIASHDLKGPLTNLRVSEVLLRSLIGDQIEQAIPVLDTVKLTISTMTQVIEDFLETAAIQSGSLDVNLDCVEVGGLIWDAVIQYTPSAYEKDISIEIEDAQGYILCDPFRLMQVLGNYLNNAIKYSSPGANVRIWSEFDSDYIRICVADEGPGIPEAEQKHLFRPFSRVGSKPTGGETSSGLGLWIAKHLISLQDGQVGVECPASGGSIFWLVLPACS